MNETKPHQPILDDLIQGFECEFALHGQVSASSQIVADLRLAGEEVIDVAEPLLEKYGKTSASFDIEKYFDFTSSPLWALNPVALYRVLADSLGFGEPKSRTLEPLSVEGLAILIHSCPEQFPSIDSLG